VTAWKLWEVRFGAGEPEVIDSGPRERITATAAARNAVARACHGSMVAFAALPAGQVPVAVSLPAMTAQRRAAEELLAKLAAVITPVEWRRLERNSPALASQVRQVLKGRQCP
jgi:hypothetical protein